MITNKTHKRKRVAWLKVTRLGSALTTRRPKRAWWKCRQAQHVGTRPSNAGRPAQRDLAWCGLAVFQNGPQAFLKPTHGPIALFTCVMDFMINTLSFFLFALLHPYLLHRAERVVRSAGQRRFGPAGLAGDEVMAQGGHGGSVLNWVGRVLPRGSPW
jgi:hypothetical protein